MVLDEQHQVSRRPSPGRRRIIRRSTAGLTLTVAVLYLVLLVLVANAEAGRSENTYGAYVFLSVAYLVGGALLARLDNRLLYLLGAIVQVGVIALFVLFGVGVFEYEALGRLHMEVWAGVVTSAEIALLGLLSYLGVTAPRRPTQSSGGLP